MIIFCFSCSNSFYYISGIEQLLTVASLVAEHVHVDTKVHI